MKKTITWLFLLGAIVAILSAPVNLGNIGTGDYRAYWSASYLLRQGQGFGSPEQMYRVEHELTDSPESYPVMTWNPPWLLVMLEPFTFFSFSRATWLWFLTDLVLGFAAVSLWWRHLAAGYSARRWMALAPVLLCIFPPTLVSLMSGQVNFLVLFGLVSFIVLWDRGRDGWAGAALALTMIKPQLVYVTLPLVLLECIRRKRLRVWFSFILVLVGLTAVAFVQRPTLISEYLGTAAGGNLLDYNTPTLGGWLDMSLGWHWAKLMGVAVLPAALLVWLLHPLRSMTRLVEVTLFVSIITAPFGWSYDHIVLLIPLVHVIVDLIEGKLPRAYTLLWTVLLILADAAFFGMRILVRNDVFFFSVPFILAAIYLIISGQVSRSKDLTFSNTQADAMLVKIHEA